MNRKHKLSATLVCTMLVLTLALLTVSFLAPTALAESVKFSVPAGVSVPSMTGNTLPRADDFIQEGVNYSFVGWVSEEVGSMTASKPAVYEAGATYDTGMGRKLHALYSFEGTAEAWTLVTSSDTALAAGSSSSNYLRTEVKLSGNSSWKITIIDTGVASIVAQGDKTNNTTRYNSSSSLFACYASDKASNQKDLCIYRYESSPVTYYQTLSCEHKNSTEHTVLEATCTETGVKELRCDSCQAILETITVDMINHSYVDGSCTKCGKIDHTSFDYSGKYVIAAKRKDDAVFQFMTNDLGTASTKRYQLISSTYIDALPETLTKLENSVFVFVKNDDGETYKIYADDIDTDEKYLGWSSGNSGTLVSEADAKDVYVVKTNDENFNIFFVNDSETRYLSFNNTKNDGEYYPYAAWYTGTQLNDLSLIPVVDASEEEPEDVKTKFSSADVSLGADLTMKYSVTLAEGENIADYSVRFTMNGNVLTVTEYVKNGGRYIFTFAGIAPQCAGVNILAELIKNGEVVDTKDNYSVLANVTSLLNKEDTTEKTKTLIADLLNYCQRLRRT